MNMPKRASRHHFMRSSCEAPNSFFQAVNAGLLMSSVAESEYDGVGTFVLAAKVGAVKAEAVSTASTHFELNFFLTFVGAVVFLIIVMVVKFNVNFLVGRLTPA
jgi:uncharacterized membrane protein YeaQ/YmgE (transglycosylase-associated protein family)